MTGARRGNGKVAPAGWAGPLIGALLVLGFVGYCVRVYATCDGRVVKGFFDQPVCVEAGR